MSGEIRAPQAGPDDARCAAEERWRAAFENPHIGVAIVGPDPRFLETNERFRELVGYTEEELRRLTVIEITHPKERPAHLKTSDLLRTGNGYIPKPIDTRQLTSQVVELLSRTSAGPGEQRQP